MLRLHKQPINYTATSAATTMLQLPIVKKEPPSTATNASAQAAPIRPLITALLMAPIFKQNLHLLSVMCPALQLSPPPRMFQTAGTSPPPEAAARNPSVPLVRAASTPNVSSRYLPSDPLHPHPGSPPVRPDRACDNRLYRYRPRLLDISIHSHPLGRLPRSHCNLSTVQRRPAVPVRARPPAIGNGGPMKLPNEVQKACDYFYPNLTIAEEYEKREELQSERATNFPRILETLTIHN